MKNTRNYLATIRHISTHVNTPPHQSTSTVILKMLTRFDKPPLEQEALQLGLLAVHPAQVKFVQNVCNLGGGTASLDTCLSNPFYVFLCIFNGFQNPIGSNWENE